jgi:Cu+-exporting ATPase
MSMVVDPVCGIQIDPEKTAVQAKFQGRTFFFCSTTCAREFEAHPQEYSTQGRD